MILSVGGLFAQSQFNVMLGRDDTKYQQITEIGTNYNMTLSISDVNFALAFNLVPLRSYSIKPFDYEGYLEVSAHMSRFTARSRGSERIELVNCTREYKETYFNGFSFSEEFSFDAYLDEGVLLCPKD